MEQPNSNDTILKQMAAFNLDAPYKVTLYFEDEEDKLDDSTEKISCTANANKKRKRTKTAKNAYFRNFYQNTVENSFNMEHGNPVTPANTINFVHSINEVAATDRGNCYPIPIQNRLLSQGKEQNHSPPGVISTMDKKHLLNMLDEISNNLIEISKCYYNTLIIPTDSRTNTAREAHYFHFKQQYFNYMYNIVDDVLLPQEKNWDFIEMLIRKTLCLARTKSWYYISREYLLNLILDITKWTKDKKMYLENIGPLETQIPTTINNRTTSSNSCITFTDTNRPTVSTCHFSSNLQNSQKTINIQPNILHEVLTPSDLENHLVKRRKINNGINHFAVFKQTSTQKQNLVSSSRHQTDLLINNLRPNEENNTLIQNENLNSENPYRILRTASRDSGYTSPDIGVSPGDQPTRSTFLSKTSLTSSVACPLPVIVCVICSTATSNVCLGCQRVHYCSEACQKKDWPSHMFQCRK